MMSDGASKALQPCCLPTQPHLISALSSRLSLGLSPSLTYTPPPHGFLPSPWTSVQASSGPDNAARSAHSAYKVSTPSTSRWCFPPLLQTWLISASREPSLNLLCPGPVATELGPILRGPTSPLQTMYVLAECKSNISVTCDLNSRNAICISRVGLQLLVDFSFFFFNLFISKYF